MTDMQVVRFVAAGGLAAGANFGSRILLSHVFPYVMAIVIAYCIGMATAFILNRLFVFQRPTVSLQHQVLWFMLINLAAVAQTVLISVGLAYYLLPALGITRHTELLAHACGVAVPVVTSYFGHKHLSFRST